MKRPLIYLIMTMLPAMGQMHAQTLEHCIDVATRHSLDMEQQQLLVQRAQQMERTAFDPARTEVTLSQDPTGGGSPENGFTFSQEFELPRVYRARSRTLKAETRMHQSQMAVHQHELAHQVSLCYYDMLVAMARVHTLQRQDSLCQQVERMAQLRLDQGEAGSMEVLQAQQARTAVGTQILQAHNELRQLQSQMQQLMDTTQVITPTLDPYTQLTLPAVGTGAFSHSVWANALQRTMEADEQRLQQARREFLPSFSVGMRAQMVLPGLNPYNVDRSRFRGGNWMGFELGMSVPLFYGAQKARVQAARTDIALGQMQYRQRQRLADNALLQARTELENAQRTLQHYQHQVVPQTMQIAALARTAYSHGEITYTECAQATQSVLEQTLASIDALAQYNRAVLQIRYLNQEP